MSTPILYYKCTSADIVRMRSSINGNTGEDAGFDVICPSNVLVPAGAYGFKIPLGIFGVMTIAEEPIAYELRARSSTACKTPLRLANAIGTIDKGYRGELCAIVDNVSNKPFQVIAGRRLFQITMPTLEEFDWKFSGEPLEKRFPSKRGAAGFGSTGK